MLDMHCQVWAGCRAFRRSVMKAIGSATPACAGAEEEAPRPAKPPGMILWRSCPCGGPLAAAGALLPVMSCAAVGGAAACAAAGAGARSSSASTVPGAALMSDMRPSSSMILTSFSLAWTRKCHPQSPDRGNSALAPTGIPIHSHSTSQSPCACRMHAVSGKTYV